MWISLAPYLCSVAGCFLWLLPWAGLTLRVEALTLWHDTRAGCVSGHQEVGEGHGGSVAVEAASGLGSDDHSSSSSQLLRDLDNCNGDPVAVASCFVERVRRAGSLPLVLFCWRLSGTETPTFTGHLSLGAPSPWAVCLVSCLGWGGCSGVAPGVAGWMACQTDGYKGRSIDTQRKGCRVALGT